MALEKPLMEKMRPEMKTRLSSSPARWEMYVVNMGWTMRMTTWTRAALTSIRRMTGIFQRLTFSPSAPAAAVSAAAVSVGGSLMKKTRTTKLRNRAPAARKKDMRMPKASARMPPKRGPMMPPAVRAPCMMPRQIPSFWGGA